MSKNSKPDIMEVALTTASVVNGSAGHKRQHLGQYLFTQVIYLVSKPHGSFALETRGLTVWAKIHTLLY